MSFKFMHNYVSTATKVPTLSDIMKKAQTSQKLTKTASSEQPVKTAKIPDFIQEKIDAKKNKGKKGVDEDDKDEKKPCGDAMPAKAAATKVAEKEKEEGETSGQLAPKANPNNEPKVEDGEKKGKSGGSKKGEGEGESSGQLDVEPLHQKGESTQEKPGSLETMKGKKASGSNARFVRVASLTTKQKDFLRRVWSVYWPKSFIDAFLARS